MAFTDRLVHRSMKKVAKRIADRLGERLPTVKTQQPNLPLHEQLFLAYTGQDIGDLPPDLREKVIEKSQTVHGFCYMMAMDVGDLKGWMVLRLLQFTKIMDEELASRGYQNISREQKERLIKLFELDKGDWQSVI